MTGALLEEGLSGAGGRLLNGKGERFMTHYDPERMERSTRDLVAARLLHRGAGGARQPARRRLDRRLASGREDGRGQLPWHGASLPRLRPRPRPRARRGGPDRSLHDGRRGHRSHLPHSRGGALRRGRGRGRCARRQPSRRQRRGRLHRVRRHSGRRDGRWVVGRALPQLATARLDTSAERFTAPWAGRRARVSTRSSNGCARSCGSTSV